MEGTRKRGRPSKRWRNMVAEDLNILGVKNREAMARDRQGSKKIVLEAKVYNGLYCWRRRRRRRGGTGEEEGKKEGTGNM